MNDTNWLDPNEYPFTSRYVNVPEGRMHYVDEGSGDTILMVHGTPTWSFLYRHLIRGLRDHYRVIAPDNLGFGLSDKPAGYSYRPADQARNLRAFIAALDLRDLTLMVHDFGGPIGLSYALEQPENIRRLVLFNTWLWPLQSDFQKVVIGQFLSSPLGRLLCLRFNFEVNVIVPLAYGDRSSLTRAIHNQYRYPLRDPIARRAVWIYARELLQSRDWYGTLWAQHGALRDIPALLLWGKRDPVFGPAYLERWTQVFQQVQTVTYAQTGHFVQEEQSSALLPVITEFMTSTT